MDETAPFDKFLNVERSQIRGPNVRGARAFYIHALASASAPGISLPNSKSSI
jgi:hypothetical protein